MNIKSKAFWLKVKEEYDPCWIYICDKSTTFKCKWVFSNTRDQIREIAEEWIIKKKKDAYTSINFLFCINNLRHKIDDKINIRKEFIEYCINKFD